MVPKISRLSPIVSIGNTFFLEKNVNDLLSLVNETKQLKEQVSKMQTEFKIIKDHLASRSTNLAELETICATMAPDPKYDKPANERSDWSLLVGYDVDRVVQIIHEDCPSKQVTKVPSGTYVPYIYQPNHIYVFYNENNKVSNVCPF